MNGIEKKPYRVKNWLVIHTIAKLNVADDVKSVALPKVRLQSITGLE